MGDGVASGLVAGHREDQDEERKLLGAQDVIVRRRRRVRLTMSPRMPFPLVAQCSGVGAEDLGCREPQDRCRSRSQLIIWFDTEDLLPVSLRESDQVGNRLECQFARDVESSRALSSASSRIPVARKPRSTSSSRATEKTPRDTTPRTLVWRGSSMLSIVCFLTCRPVADRAAVELGIAGHSTSRTARHELHVRADARPPRAHRRRSSSLRRSGVPTGRRRLGGARLMSGNPGPGRRPGWSGRSHRARGTGIQRLHI